MIDRLLGLLEKEADELFLESIETKSLQTCFYLENKSENYLITTSVSSNCQDDYFPDSKGVRESKLGEQLNAVFHSTRKPIERLTLISEEHSKLLKALVEELLKHDDISAFEEALNQKQNPNTEENFRDISGFPNLFQTIVESIWKGDKENCFEILKRIEFSQVSFQDPQERINRKIRVLINGAKDSVLSSLINFIHSEKHDVITPSIVKQYLNHCGLPFLEPPTEKVSNRNQEFLKRLKNETALPMILSRKEAKEVIERFEASNDQTAQRILITGEAGIGKSGVLIEVAEKLIEKGVPVLAFRMDELSAVDDCEKILPEIEGSPVNILATIAKAEKALLIIDQLDACSEISGRNVTLLYRVEEILNQLEEYSNITLLLACRNYDLENDKRLERIQKRSSSTINVNNLNKEEIHQFLKKMNYQDSLISESQIKLLSVPLHIGLLAKIMSHQKQPFLEFDTRTDLFDQFWDLKQTAISEQFPSYNEAIQIICSYFDKNQVLSIPSDHKDLVDKLYSSTEIGSLISENILIEKNHKYSFFHETFFDYLFIRAFVTKGFSLTAHLGKKESQFLFRRNQTKEILQYQQKCFFTDYISNIKSLLRSDSIRWNLKAVIISVIGDVQNPTDQEFELLNPYLDDMNSPYYRFILRAWYYSSPWFNYLNEKKYFLEWIKSEKESRINLLFRLLGNEKQSFPDDLVEIISFYIPFSKYWKNNVKSLFRRKDFGRSEALFKLFLMVAKHHDDENSQNHSGIKHFSWDFDTLLAQNPIWACQALEVYMNRCFQLSLSRDPEFLNRNEYEIKFEVICYEDVDFIKIANSAPVEFIKHMIPFLNQILFLGAVKQDYTGELSPPWCDRFWHFRSDMKSLHFSSSRFLDAIITAVVKISKEYPHYFSTISSEFQNSDYEVFYYVLAKAYSKSREEFAEEAIHYLYDHFEELIKGHEYEWTIHDLLKAISPYCSDKMLQQCCDIILEYYSPYESRESRGITQFNMLQGVIEEKRSQKVIKRIQEWQRKFGRERFLPPLPSRTYRVGSPISEGKTEKMTNDQWITAIEKYDSEKPEPSISRKGNAFQLSQTLQSAVQNDPARFVLLFENLPDNTSHYYFDAFLRGLENTEIEIEPSLVIQSIKRCDRIPRKPCGITISSLIGKFSGIQYPEEVLDIILYYATKDKNPEKELWKEGYYGGSLLNCGISTVRGRAADSIATLLWEDQKYFEYFKPSLKAMVLDPSLDVRSCVANCLNAVFNYDQQFSIRLFKKLCEAEEQLFLTPHVEYFIRCTLSTHLKDLQPILERMLSSKEPEVQTEAAIRVAVLYLTSSKNNQLLEQCKQGTENHRKGLVTIFLNNLQDEVVGKICEEQLIDFFDDPDESIRKATIGWLSYIKDKSLNEYQKMARAFIQSRSIENINRKMFELLLKSSPLLIDEGLLLCGKVLEMNNDDSYAYALSLLDELLIKIYSNSKDLSIRKRCLDYLDQLYESPFYWELVEEQLKQHDSAL